MKNRFQHFLSLFKSSQPIPPGMYAYQSPPDSPFPQKIYLRVEPSGHSILVMNASVILHLNPVATEFAYGYLHQFDEEQIIRSVLSKYRIDRETAVRDYRSFLEKLHAITTEQDLDPVEFFGFERAAAIDWGNISAPYRLDCALTYRLPENAAAKYAPIERVKEELSTEQWKTIIDKAWKAGIPHIIFTGGEPTYREDLLELILHTEKNAQICGLITDGHLFHNDQTLSDFLNAGLDHLMLLLDPHNEQSWQVIEKITPLDLFTAVHLTIEDAIFPQLAEIISRLAHLGINALSLSAISEERRNVLHQASELAFYHGLELVWDLPVPYSKFNPIRLELIEEEQRDNAGKTSLYVEPDGDVLLAQGIPTVLGNLLTQEWGEIWQTCLQYVQDEVSHRVA